MKTMTCAQLGGPCDAPMSAATPEEMTKLGMEHVTAAHPDMAEKIKAMSKEETDKWMADFMVKWAATPESM